jgi:dihydrofolate synthase/folylpolyglutamate synthase
MTYKEATEYIEHLKSFGITPGLAAMSELCRRLDNPQDRIPFVHIAGTNGKGSVLCFISAILKASGYRTGRFFSPAISECRERFQINNRQISKNDFCRYLERIKEVAGGMVADGFDHPTSFEVDTALAFLYFADKNCDIVVLETGMGGTFDATNVIRHPLVAVIMPVGMDHTDYLGRTLAEIAGHKAGIIKAGACVITGRQSEAVYEVIREKCSECGCRPLFVSPLGTLSRIRKGKADFKNLAFRQCFTYCGCDFEIGLAGPHQIINAATALDAVLFCPDRGSRPVRKTSVRVCGKRHGRAGLS